MRFGMWGRGNKGMESDKDLPSSTLYLNELDMMEQRIE
jgi:hypothetical protein